MQTKKYAAAITSLMVEFNKCFQDFAAIKKDMLLFSSPFSVDPDDCSLSTTALKPDLTCIRSQELSITLLIDVSKFSILDSECFEFMFKDLMSQHFKW